MTLTGLTENPYFDLKFLSFIKDPDKGLTIFIFKLAVWKYWS